MAPNALSNLMESINIQLPTLVLFASYLLVIYIFYRVISIIISEFSKKSLLTPHIENLGRLLLRVVAILSAILAFFHVYNLPTSWLLGSSAFVGAFLGFGSSQTINNIIAGFYVIFSKPFEVKDYVKIGLLEGQVDEISINYTKIYTPTFNLHLIPNIQVLNSQILNCTHEGFIKNTYVFTLPHATPLHNDEIINKCFYPAVSEIVKKYSEVLVRRPEIYFDNSTHFGRGFKIRLFVPKGHAKTMYVIQSELSNRFLQLFDEERLRPPTP